MIIIKKHSPEFYDCKCDKCHAEFLYQLEDIKEKEFDLSENDNPVLSMMLPNNYRYVVCPCCRNKIPVGLPNPYYGLGFGVK